MHDNKYIYFKNVIFNYDILTYSRMNIYDRKFVFLTILDILSNGYEKNILFVLKYFKRYTINVDKLLYYNKVPTLKDLCIHKIKRQGISCDNLPYILRLQIHYPIYSVYDVHEQLIDYFTQILRKDKHKFLDFLVNKYLYLKQHTPSLCDYKPTELPTNSPTS